MAGEGFLPPVVAELRASITDFQAKMGEAKAEMTATGEHAQSTFGSMASLGKGALLGIAGTAIAVGAVSLKMAGDFQESMTQLVTGAGESQANMALVSDGILSLAPKVGQSTKALADAMFTVESAGYHGAAGLEVLRIAAEGARVGNAQLPDVANAVTSALNAYHLSASSSADVMNTLTATVASGKMHMQDLATSLSTVMPSAAALGVPLEQVGAALATMTMQGTSADNAATYLRFTLAALVNPTAKARGEMELMGIKSSQVSDLMTHQGLPQALQFITDHIANKFKPGSAEYTAALANMVGGTRGMQAALELTGSHLQTFEDNVSGITDKVEKGRGGVEGWAEVQKDFNFKVAQAKEQVEVLGIKIGTWLIPKIEEATRVIISIVDWLGKHKTVAEILAVAIGTVLVVAIGAYIVSMLSAAVATIAAVWPILAIIAAVAIVGVAIYELATHWSTVWQFVKDIAADAWRWVDDHLVQPLVDAFNNTIVMPLLFLRDTFKAAWDTVTSIVGAAKDFIVDHLNLILILGLGPLGVEIDILKEHWAAIWNAVCFVVDVAWGLLSPVFGFIIHLGIELVKTAVQTLREVWSIEWAIIHTVVSTAWDVLKKVFGFIVDLGIHVVRDEINSLKTIWDTAWSAFHTAVDTMWAVVQPILHILKQTLDDIVGPLEKVANGIGGVIGGAGNVAGKIGGFLGLAEGGIVTKPTLAMIGEGGGPEVVLPLNNPARMVELLGLVSSSIPAAAVLSGASGGSSSPISLTASSSGAAGGASIEQNITIHASGTSREIADEIGRQIASNNRDLLYELSVRTTY